MINASKETANAPIQVQKRMRNSSGRRIDLKLNIGQLAVSLLALIIAGLYFRRKLVHGLQKYKFFLQSAIYVWVGVCANLQFAKAYQKSYLKFFVLI